jgi:glucosamine--fructose-6-phosphate aminotransferase (isomerizing)
VNSPGVTFLERELRSQGDVLAARTEDGWEDAARAAEILRRADVDCLVIAARGSSDNAARYAQYLFGSVGRLLVGLAAPWLYSADAPPVLKRAAVMAISQSGRSPDIAGVVEAARAQGRPTIAITNEPSSAVADAADVVVPLRAGVERSVAATKTYLSSLHALSQIAACMVGRSARVELADWFDRLPGIVDMVVEDQLAGRERFDRLSEASLLTVVGRGLAFPTAYETALKVRELSGIPAEAFSPPDLMHGPIAGLSRSGAVWVVSTAGREQPDREALDTLRSGAGVSVAVSDAPWLLAEVDVPVPVKAGLPDWVAPLVTVVPGQAAALRLAEVRGIDVDRPLGLSKVTLTR